MGHPKSKTEIIQEDSKKRKKRFKLKVGRGKIQIKTRKKKGRIGFSKRRDGLMKKAGELSTHCGAQVAVVVFSQGGQCFSFGSPSVDSVLHRFRSQPSPSDGVPPSSPAADVARCSDAMRQELLQQTVQQQQSNQVALAAWDGALNVAGSQPMTSGLVGADVLGMALDTSSVAPAAQVAADDFPTIPPAQVPPLVTDGYICTDNLGDAGYSPFWATINFDQDFGMPF